jgi:hypothetical protein
MVLPRQREFGGWVVGRILYLKIGQIGREGPPDVGRKDASDAGDVSRQGLRVRFCFK